jgi:SAM-dependent methyltransferase
MNVTWVHFGSIVSYPAGPDSTLASARYRILIPGRELARRGHAVRYARFHTNADGRAIMAAGHGDVVVVSKLSSTCAVATRYFARKTMSLMERLRARGVRVVVDLSDYQFEKPELAVFMESLPGLCDGAVACTQELAEALRARAGIQAQVIGDPVEGARSAARAPRPGGALRVLWFGHQSNLATLEAFVPALRDYARRAPVSLRVVTAANAGAERLVADGPLPVAVTAWSRQAQAEALAECDVVIIPSRVDTAVQRSKSANRIVESAWAGRFAVASPLPSYRVLAQWMWVDEDLIAGLEFARSHAEEVKDRISAAQSYIGIHHSPERIADRWEEILRRVARGPAGRPLRGAGRSAADAPIHVHLGNGTGNLDGCLNIHLEPARAAPPPDIVCDLNDLVYLEDASIDGLSAVQVLQHFTPRLAEAAVAEWRRVLRPGACLAVECPDLQALCRAVSEGGAADPEILTGLFGEAAEHGTRLPYRSGYTAESLIALFGRAGFVRVRREAPRIGQGAWVMRVVGEAPGKGQEKKGPRTEG